MATSLKTSVLVNDQVPEYIQDEYPVFINFLEAYYEFLEQKQGTKKNDLITKSKDLRYVSDVDSSIDDFEDNFFSTYGVLVPKDSVVSKEFLIKNILPLYLSRGNPKSFEFLFRLLYGTEVTITYPKDNILKASAGNWTVENVIRINNDVYSFYTGNGNTTTFLLAQQSTENDVEVYVNDVLTSSGFYIRKEDKKLIFNSAPASGAKIRVVYDDFDETLFAARKVTGLTSGATAIIERAAPRLITQQTSIELYVNPNNLTGSFTNAETISTDIIADDGTLIVIRSDTVATLSSITITNAGASYNVGDPVTIIGGAPTSTAEAVVDSVESGFPESVTIYNGGSGFQNGGLIHGIGPSGIITLAVNAVDTTGANSANSFSIFSDFISPYANTLLSASNYGFPANVIPTGENVSTRLIDALSVATYTDIGPITNAIVLFANTAPNNVVFDAEGAKYDVTIDIKSFGALGRFKINNGGTGYKIGDEIVFGANPPSTYGFGAAAAVTNVSSTGAITKIELQPSRITGVANTTSNGIVVLGTGTSFDTELQVGDRIMINSEARYVNAISSATSLNVNVAFGRTSTERKVGVFNRYSIGGQNYVQNNFPSVTVSSTAGTNANVQIYSIMGDGETLTVFASTTAGAIKAIRVTNAGAGYQFVPTIDLSGYGDGTATATAEIERSYVSFPGKWVGSDGIISSFDRKLEGLDYYIDFTYLTSVETEFSKYRDILKDLLHPAGFKNYAEYPINRTIDTTITVDGEKTDTISGRVSTTNGSASVTGTGTKFVTANAANIIYIGAQISVNNQIRTISNIVSNTVLTVSSAFTNNSSAQTLIIIA